jgi:hypothetical protein
MNVAIPDAIVTGYEPQVDRLDLPDLDDRHVLAAAIRSGATSIVTANLADFPRDVLARYGIEPLAPDEFVLRLVHQDLDDAVVEVVDRQAADLRNPPMSTAELLDGQSWRSTSKQRSASAAARNRPSTGAGALAL